MFITKVELENIKSYRSARIEFRRGTTAIRGENGAGKTTVVEAIGFALFDYLPYSQAQFVREGERGGKVVVSFIAKDDVEYEAVRRCGTPSSWYIFNPQLEMRVAEQKADVIAWLKEYLPLEGELEPKDFFSDALGVPQGTFTSDFLATATSRKSKFDALLQVEAYRKASDKLRETTSYLDKEASKLEGRIAGLEVEAGAIETLRAELERLRENEHGNSGRLLTAQTERDAARQRLDALRRLEAEVTRLEREREREEAIWRQSEERHQQAQAALEEAAAARRVLYESASAYALFQQATDALQQARQQQRDREPLLVRLQAHREHLTMARVNVKHAEEKLAQANAACQQMTALAPKVQEQAALEEMLATLNERVKRLRQVQREIEQLEQEQAKRLAELRDLARQMAAIEAQRAEAALLGERRGVVNGLHLEAGRRADWADELRRVHENLRGVELRRQKTQAELEKRRAEVKKLYENQPVAERLAVLEATFSTLDERVVLLRTNIKRHNESKLQSVGGQCPFLKEPCLNIRQKGQSSLEAYFDGLIARDQHALVPLETEREELEQQLQETRRVKLYVDRLPEYEQALGKAQESHDEVLHEMERLMTRVRELEGLLGGAGDHAQRLAEAQALLQQSEAADKQVSRLADLARQHAGLQEQVDAQAGQLDGLQRECAGLLETPAEQAAVTERLSALGNPRHEFEQHEQIARQQQEAAIKLEEVRWLIAQAEEALAALEVELAPYAGLEARLDELTRQQEQSQPGYQAYLANKQMAGKLPERQVAQAATQAAEQKARERYEEAAQHYDEVTAGFDAEALKRVDEEYVDLSNRVTDLQGTLGRIRDDIEKQKQHISAAEAKQAELEAAKAEQREIVETRAMLAQFRGTIKEAGPYVMKELLRQISREANRIFGDILGDHAAELAWEEDYEVVLRSKGQTRSFAQLSGGEQMSAALAVRLALLKTLSGLDIAFFDEPTQNMDETRRTNLAEQIKRVRGFNQLIVISHDDTFEQGLDSFVYLQKQGGETMVGAGGLGEDEPALVGSASEEGW